MDNGSKVLIVDYRSTQRMFGNGWRKSGFNKTSFKVYSKIDINKVIFYFFLKKLHQRFDDTLISILLLEKYSNF